ncbi:MAG: PAS domain S-box protein, partial [Gammaproteobacteria bacterium]|nr:PAS domain S-box protein [Gammaproteobacteria bacterium]
MSAIPLPPAEGPVAAGATRFPNPALPTNDAERTALLAALVESSHDSIISMDLEGRILSWNPGATRLYGYRAEEVIGRPVRLIVPPELQAEEAQMLARLCAGERIEHFETERVRKDGQRVLISLSISPIRDARGVVIGASRIARDVSEVRRTEQLRSHFAAIVESSDDAIVGKSLDGIVQSWNRGAERIFGYTP